jgi:hypothetical protein
MPTLGWNDSAANERRMEHMDRSRSGAEETAVSITPPKTWAVRVPAVANPLRCSLERTTVRRTALTLPDEATSGGEHDHAARLPERTTSGAVGATATAPRSDGP